MKEILSLHISGIKEVPQALSIVEEFEKANKIKVERVTLSYCVIKINLTKSGGKELAKEIKARLEKEKIKWREMLDKFYTYRELLSYELLLMIIPTAPFAIGSTDFGTKYNFSHACPRCGAGARQISPLIIGRIPEAGVGRKNMGKRDIGQTYDGEIIITERVKELLERERFTGLKLWPVYWYTDKEMTHPIYWQIYSTHTLPPMSPKSKGITVDKSMQCPVCKRPGHFDTRYPQEYHYRRSDLKKTGIKDFNFTWELFGASKKTHPAPAKLIVTPRVLRLFKEAKVRRVEFLPVFIDEE